MQNGEIWLNPTTGEAYFNNNGTLQSAGASTSAAETVLNGSTAATLGGVKAFQVGSPSIFEMWVGSSSPINSAPQGSVYWRTDGSSTTRCYINTAGSSTTWTAFAPF